MKSMNRLFIGVLALLGTAIAVTGCSPVDAGEAANMLTSLWPHVDLSSSQLLGFAAVGSIKQLAALRGKREGLVSEMQALLAAADGRGDGLMTDAERVQFDELEAKIKGLDGDITRVQSALDTQRSGSSVTIPDGSKLSVEDNLAKDPKGGFNTFGEYASAVRQVALASAGGHQAGDPRILVLNAGPTNMAGEASGDSLGILIPPEFSQAIFKASTDELDALLPLTDNIPVDGNSMTFPVDESTPWGQSGVKAYWQNEGGKDKDSAPSLDPATLRLNKLTALVPVTEELVEDSPALGAYLNSKTPEAITWKTNEALWGGDGVGKPRGYSNSGVVITVAKELNQGAATILRLNVSKMRARMTPAQYRRAIWMVNADALPQLDELAYGQQSTNSAIYNPEGGFGFGVLLGRPVMVSPHSATLGEKFDISLVDWKSYRTITKARGIETATSMHLWFDLGLVAFRAQFRVAGQSALTKPITPNNGANTQSPFVTLAART